MIYNILLHAAPVLVSLVVILGWKIVEIFGRGNK